MQQRGLIYDTSQKGLEDSIPLQLFLPVPDMVIAAVVDWSLRKPPRAAFQAHHVFRTLRRLRAAVRQCVIFSWTYVLTRR